MRGDVSLRLDHVGLVTPDLEASKEDYEKLGFRLTQESSHKGKVTPEGKVELWGSGNRCAMFQRGYFEILGVTDPERYHEHFRALLDKFHGVQLVALGCDSAETLYEKRRSDVKGLKEPVEIGRDVPVGLEGEATTPGLFRIVHLDESVFPEAELFFIEHRTPDALWQESLLEHPNGVTGLAGVVLCSNEPEATASRFAAATLLGAEDLEDERRFALDGGWISVVTPERIADLYPDAVLAAVPSIVVVSLTVTDLDATRAFLKANGITPHRRGDGGDATWVRPERAGGVILELRADTL